MEEQQQYQQPTQPTPEEAKLNDMTSDAQVVSEGDMQAQQERVMFEKHVQTNGVEIPSNFKSAGDWFNSLKEAQGQYTQARQEIADLKTTYSDKGTDNPNYQEPTPEVTPEATPEFNREEELRLRSEQERTPPTPPQEGLTEDMWNEWSRELAITGEISEESVQNIMEKTKFPRAVVDDFVSGQLAKRKESFNQAAQIVCSKEKLQTLFEWAETNLSADEQTQVNMGLASPSYEVTLRGLASMFDERSASAEKSREPMATPNLQQMPGSETGYVSYRTKREFMADRNNPRFRVEPNFRAAVEQRMMRTDFNSLPK